MNRTEQQKMIDDFESHYNYDSTYMRELLDSSQQGFAKFNNFLPLASHKEKLSAEEYWVAKLAAMQVEDCGECLQLNVRMALEEEVSKHLVETVLRGGQSLPKPLKDVYDYAIHVASNCDANPELINRMTGKYDKGALLEFGLCIATAKVFPTTKRALGYTKSCSLVEIEV